jgi:hypothetical protein
VSKRVQFLSEIFANGFVLKTVSNNQAQKALLTVFNTKLLAKLFALGFC